MMNLPAKNPEQPAPATLENVLVRGDLKDLSEQQRTEYYLRVCKSLGLNPSTRPFDYLTLNGKLQLYARRDAADQLRKINGISIEVVSRVHDGDLYTVHVRAKDRDGRIDEDFGVVPFKGGASEIAANSVMKAITKAKRRVTLSISGLGFLDETEIPAKHEQTVVARYDLPDDPPDEQPEEPHQLSVPQLANNAGTDWRAFGTKLTAILRACETKAEAFTWLEKNRTLLNEMRNAVPKMSSNLDAVIEEIKKRAIVMSSNPHLDLAVRQHKIIRDRLLAEDTDIDEQTLADTTEGLTDLHELLAAVVRGALEDEMLGNALKARMTEMAERRNRFELRAERRRQLVRDLMLETDITQLKQADFTASLRQSSPHVVVTDEKLIPQTFWEQRPHLRKRELLDALKDGAQIEGAALSNVGMSLSVRTR